MTNTEKSYIAFSGEESTKQLCLHRTLAAHAQTFVDSDFFLHGLETFIENLNELSKQYAKKFYFS